MKESVPVQNTQKSQDRKHGAGMRGTVVVSSKIGMAEKNGEGKKWQKKRDTTEVGGTEPDDAWTRRTNTAPTFPRQIASIPITTTEPPPESEHMSVLSSMTTSIL